MSKWPFTKEEEKGLPRRLEEFSRNFKYFMSHEDELRPKYANKCIAIFNCEVVDHDDDRDVLEMRLRDNCEEVDFNSMYIISHIRKEKVKGFLYKKVVAS